MISVLRRLTPILAILFALGCGSAFADDWLLQRSKGTVEIQTFAGWKTVSSGQLIADGTTVRTGALSRARLLRGKEWLDLGPETMIVIHDRDGQQFTTVVQTAGQLEVEAEVRNVQHFAVQTPLLAAVVKGTHFTVRITDGNAAVDVSRGLVEVDTRSGKSYGVPKGAKITVSAAGEVKGSATVTPGKPAAIHAPLSAAASHAPLKPAAATPPTDTAPTPPCPASAHGKGHSTASC